MRFEAALRDHFQGRTPSFECEYRVRDGSWRWLIARGRCLRDAEGRPYRFVGSAVDVTAQKQAQSDRDQLEARFAPVAEDGGDGYLGGRDCS